MHIVMARGYSYECHGAQGNAAASVEEVRKMKHDEKVGQMRCTCEEARRLWGAEWTQESESNERARPVSHSQRNGNMESGKLIRRPRGYQKGSKNNLEVRVTGTSHPVWLQPPEAALGKGRGRMEGQ
ncbi:hypothetical protein FIBSPDRAFT_889342 [Athelia psychrophila]|uniref:Uncharacterized protein n=1 Tax=Athelia psychrophila TaxID=1759441 RepID=A0A166MB14_9AGAM|nr:hypothetical protein FIBSPDRAFT_889342 [Fibularhizoctonia sp. CBS 109695]